MIPRKRQAEQQLGELSVSATSDKIRPIEIADSREPTLEEERALLEDNHPPATRRPAAPGSKPEPAESPSSKSGSHAHRMSVREAMASIDKRFGAICKWCGHLQACRTAEAWEDQAPQNGDMLLGIQNSRHQGEWRLEFAQRSPGGNSRQSEFKPLADAPLDLKLRALALSEKLLKELVAQQREVIREIRSALKQFDSTAASLGVKLSRPDKEPPAETKGPKNGPFSTIELS